MTGYISSTLNKEIGHKNYKVGSIYTFKGVLFEGFRFCKDLKDLFVNVPEKGFRVYQIETLGEVRDFDSQNIVFITNCFRVIKEEKVDINDWVKFDERGNIIYFKNHKGVEHFKTNK